MAMTLGAQTLATAVAATQIQATLTGVQAGDLLVAAVVFQNWDTSDGVSASDATNGAYTNAQALPNYVGHLFFFQNSQAGDHTVTISWTGSNSAHLNFSRWAGERGTGGKDQSSTDYTVSGTSHPHGSITTGGAGLIVTASGQSQLATETVATGFTALTSPESGRAYFQYKLGTGAETTTGTYTTAETLGSRSGIANFLGAATGGTDTPIEVPSGSLSLTGAAATLALAVAVPACALALTGQVPLSGATHITTVPTQALTLTGYAPSATTFAHIITVPTGALVLQGAENSSSIEAWPDTVDLALAGASPALDHGIGVPACALALAGAAPRLATNMPVPVGALALASDAPTVALGNATVITPPTGELALAGGDAPALNQAVGVPAGALTIVGAVPSLTELTTVITPPTCALALVGQSITPALNIPVPGQSLVLEGYVPAAERLTAGTVVPPTATLALVGAAPAVALVVTVPTGTLALAGAAATLAVVVMSPNITVPTGALTFRGLPPATGGQIPRPTHGRWKFGVRTQWKA